MYVTEQNSSEDIKNIHATFLRDSCNWNM